MINRRFMIVPPALPRGGHAGLLGELSEEFSRLRLETAKMRVPTIAESRVMILHGAESASPGTPIALTQVERHALEALAGSRKSEARMHERARIVLLAAGGIGSRAIAPEMDCAPGTASKWRVRFARDLMSA